MQVATQVGEWVKTWNLGKLKDIRKTSNLDGDIVQYLVFLTEIKLW